MGKIEQFPIRRNRRPKSEPLISFTEFARPQGARIVVTLAAACRWWPEFEPRLGAFECAKLLAAGRKDEAAAWWRGHQARLRRRLIERGVDAAQVERLAAQHLEQVRVQIDALRKLRLTRDQWRDIAMETLLSFTPPVPQRDDEPAGGAA